MNLVRTAATQCDLVGSQTLLSSERCQSCGATEDISVLNATLAKECGRLRHYYGDRVDGFVSSAYVAHDFMGTWLMYRLCDPKDMRKGKLAHRFCCRVSGPALKLADSDHDFGECVECTYQELVGLEPCQCMGVRA